jgi:hypothetical protein
MSKDNYALGDKQSDSFVLDGGGNYARRTVSGIGGSAYDSAEFSVGNGVTNYDVADNQSDLWDNITSPRYVMIRTDKTVTLRFNANTNAGISITASDSPFVLEGVITVTNIYISNSSGSSANIKVFLA